MLDGKTGFLVENESAMSIAVNWLPGIAARDCRAWATEHCDADVVAASYERTFQSAARGSVDALPKLGMVRVGSML